MNDLARVAYRARQRGMTLIEVLVAFTILAGVSLSVLALISQNTRYMVSAEEKLLASIAVDNLLTTDLAVLATPSAGSVDGEIAVADETLSFTRNVIEISDGAVLIEYSVARQNGAQTLSRASALKAKN